MHYQLYVPGVTNQGNKNLEAFGLQELLRGGSPEWMPLAEPGPDKGGGSLCGWSSKDSAFKLGLWPEMIEWTPCPPDPVYNVAAGAYWLGLHRESVLLPEELVRADKQPSDPVELADGQIYEIPICRLIHHYNGIHPESGEHIRTPDPEYEAFCREAERYAFEIFQEVDQGEWLKESGLIDGTQDFSHPLELEQTWDFACKSLSINYRLFPFLISHLKLLDDRCLVGVVLAAIELPLLQYMQAQKKTEFPTPLSVPVG